MRTSSLGIRTASSCSPSAEHRVAQLTAPISSQLVKRLEGSAHFDELAHILFDQALLAEGGQLEDPAAYVRRVNALLTA